VFHGNQGHCSKRNILADVFGTNAKMKLARRKLDALGQFKNRCSTLNSEDVLRKRDNMMSFAADLAEIESLKEKGKEESTEVLEQGLTDCEGAHAALKKLLDKKGRLTLVSRSALKKAEMSALLWKF